MVKKVPAKPKVKKPVPAVQPTADLVQLAGQIPVEILQQIATAIASGSWMVAVWRVADGQVHLDRTTISFPNGDLDIAMQLLADNLKK